MGKWNFSYLDADNQSARVNMPTSDLTSLNIDDELVAHGEMITALNAVLIGNLISTTVIAKVSPWGAGPASDPTAQRHVKAVVRYHDSVTFVKASMELPMPDRTKMNTALPGVYYRNGSTGNHADWAAVVAALTADIVGPGGNTIVVDEIVEVGRTNLG